MSRKIEFYDKLSELLSEYKVAIICDSPSAPNDRLSDWGVGFQFGIHNEMSGRCHITGADALYLSYKECKNVI